MTSYLPIGIEELLSGAVEGTRLELKATWEPEHTGWQIVKTLCAFANDLQNLNGGYVVVGVTEAEGVAVRPVKGVPAHQLEAAQKWIRGHCNRIEPVYMPVMDTPEVDGQRVLVLWAPASDNRPHQAPDGPTGQRQFWVRLGGESVAAREEILTRLLQQTARIPFDDRRAFGATSNDLRVALAREFLHDVRSDLAHEPDAERIYAGMRLTRPQNGQTAPRNVGLLFFSDDPQRWLRGARIEVVQFADDAGGNTIEEKVFLGPLHHQIRQCLTWLDNLTTRHLQKEKGLPEARGWVSYPSSAMREALVNAVYHRSYEDAPEPTKVYLYPDRAEVISYPGPVDGIEREHFGSERPLPPVPARNRRIGELLKELRLAEGRGTGIPKIFRSMRDNGSPPPQFDFDPGRTYFRVTLPAHPEYLALMALRNFAYRKATGDEQGALRGLLEAYDKRRTSVSLATALVKAQAEKGDLVAARRVVDEFPEASLPAFSRVLAALATALMDAKQEVEARAVLDRLPELLSAQDAFDAAIAERRAGRQQRAHRYFQAAGDLVFFDVRALHEFAQTKIRLTGELSRSRQPEDRQARHRLLQEAATYLERVLQMDAPDLRHAWAWYDLGRVRRWLKRPRSEVVEALARAKELAPGETRFVLELKAALSR
ncbi:MAG: RNA-binding domain-containing protein [Thermodesulfobacteriota bacterium]